MKLGSNSRADIMQHKIDVYLRSYFIMKDVTSDDKSFYKRRVDIVVGQTLLDIIHTLFYEGLFERLKYELG